MYLSIRESCESIQTEINYSNITRTRAKSVEQRDHASAIHVKKMIFFCLIKLIELLIQVLIINSNLLIQVT